MLNKRQKRFTEEYTVDLNATEAARRAGYSARTARAQGSRLLTNADIQAAIQAVMAKRAKRTEIDQDKVIGELVKIAFGDMADLMEWGPKGLVLKDSAELTPDIRAAVQEVSETVTREGGSLRLKRHDKVKALELLGRHLGMWNDKLNLSGSLTWEQFLEAADKR